MQLQGYKMKYLEFRYGPILIPPEFQPALWPNG